MTTMSKFPRNPDRPPAFSPHDPRYYDARDLEWELRRTFQVCHECRMCVNFCESFPVLFRAVDRDIDSGRAEGAELIDDADIRAVSEQCWQCKLCYIKCPYTADEDSSELLDFPRLMAREKAARARRDGVTFVDRVLGEPQLMGFWGSGPMAAGSNLIQANRLLRKVQQAVTGISSEFPLPPFATKPFPKWMKNHRPAHSAGERGEVVMFATCYGNFNTPSVPKAAVQVLEHVGYRVLTVEETCCGMPNLDGGDVQGAIEKIRANTRALIEHVRAGRKVIVPSSTCGYTMKREWAQYVPEDDVRAVASASRDLMEFIEELRKAKELPPPENNEGLGKVAYHAPCHLRAQKIGFPAARVLSRVLPDTEVEIIQECSAVDGTWGMKAEHYETGRRYAKRLVREVKGAQPDLVVTDCPLSALRIEQENRLRAIHPIEALARGFGLT
jgi:glycerol-3-phosphate dehydrogenase subunit C